MTDAELNELITKNVTFDHRRINILSMGFNCHAQAQLNKSQIYSPAHILSFAGHPYDLDFTPQYELIKRGFCDFRPENIIGKTYFSDSTEHHNGFVMGPDQFYYAFPHYDTSVEGVWEEKIEKRINSLMTRIKDSSKPRLIYAYRERVGYKLHEADKPPVYVFREFDKEAQFKLIDNAIKFHYDLLEAYPCPHQKLIIGIGTNRPSEVFRPIMLMDDIEIWYVHYIEWTKIEKVKTFLKESNETDVENVERMFAFNNGVMNTGILVPHINELIRETYKK